ncbi:unnamed protein product, partial [Laminaria digitata]
VSHLLSVVTGSSPAGLGSTAVNPAEFIVLRKAFVFALPHPRSEDWKITYGVDGDPFRRLQVKALWSAFQREVSEGLSPVISYPTKAIADSLPAKHNTTRPPPPPPPHRVFQPPLAIAPGHYKLPDENCFSPRSSCGGRAPCSVEESNETSVLFRDVPHAVEGSDETSALGRRPEGGHCKLLDEKCVSPRSRGGHAPYAVEESERETSALLRLDEDEQPEKKKSVARHPTLCLVEKSDGHSTSCLVEESDERSALLRTPEEKEQSEEKTS